MLVLFLDDDRDLRCAMEELLALWGHKALTVGSFSELVALGENVRQCRLAILDINLGANTPSGLDAFRWLRERHFPGAIVFLTGHGRSDPMVVDVLEQMEGTRTVVLEKPLPIEVLEKLLTEGHA